MNTPYVLVVDDERIILPVIERYLTRVKSLEHHEILTTTNPKEALSLIGELGDLVDLVLSDFIMPEINGIQVLSHAKEKAPLAGRILFTAYRDQISWEELINQGVVNGYINKPIDENERDFFQTITARLQMTYQDRYKLFLANRFSALRDIEAIYRLDAEERIGTIKANVAGAIARLPMGKIDADARLALMTAFSQADGVTRLSDGAKKILGDEVLPVYGESRLGELLEESAVYANISRINPFGVVIQNNYDSSVLVDRELMIKVLGAVMTGAATLDPAYKSPTVRVKVYNKKEFEGYARRDERTGIVTSIFTHYRNNPNFLDDFVFMTISPPLDIEPDKNDLARTRNEVMPIIAKPLHMHDGNIDLWSHPKGGHDYLVLFRRDLRSYLKGNSASQMIRSHLTGD